MMRVRRWLRRAALAGAGVSAAVLAVASLAAPASADPPTEVGWWSDAPSPTTPAGGIHVAVAPHELLAYGAVLFTLPATATATVTLKIAGSHGTGALIACPTTGTDWKAGADQPMSAAPAYDCSAHTINAVPSADGSSLTFLVDGSVESVPGTLSLAILPVRTTGLPVVGTDAGTDLTQPYAVDIAKPDSSALTVTGGATPGALPAGPSPASAPAPAPGGAGPPSTGAPPAGTVPMPAGPATGSVPVDPAAGAAPVVAGAAPQGAVTPVARSASDRNTAHDAALALLLLLAVALVGGTSSPRAPRRIGGRGAAAPVAVTQDAAVLGTRGLGRFARARTAPPRPLT